MCYHVFKVDAALQQAPNCWVSNKYPSSLPYVSHNIFSHISAPSTLKLGNLKSTTLNLAQNGKIIGWKRISTKVKAILASDHRISGFAEEFSKHPSEFLL